MLCLGVQIGVQEEATVLNYLLEFVIANDLLGKPL